MDYLNTGSVWRYLDDGSDQGAVWQSTSFNDASWASGSAQLGYGDSDEATVVNFGSDSGNKFITTYFRQSFTVTNASRVQDLTIELLRDDGAVVYLNGSEVVRSNMPTGTITSATVASSAIGGSKEDRFYTYSISPALLRSGTNVIAVEVHQRGGSSSDVSFDLSVAGNEILSSPDTEAPDTPANLTATAVSATKINLAWDAALDNGGGTVVGYNIYRDGDPTPIATVTATSFSDTGLAANTLYNYVVTAIDTASPVNESGRTDSSATTLAVTIPVPVSYLVSGSSWHYLDDGSNQGTAWQTNGFDDSSWSMGTAQLGYGDSDEATVVNFGSDSGNKFITTYFRQSFTVTNASRVQDLTIELLRDDGAVVYLNGSEVVRSNMPTGTITSATVASSAIGGSKEDRFYTYSISPALLRSGTNVIAVEVHQRGGSSSDVSFDLSVAGNEILSSPDTEAPDTPANLTATAVSATKINLAWDAALDNGGGTVVGYNIYRDGDPTPIATVIATSFSDTGLAANTLYNYVVTAIDTASPVNESGRTGSSATTLAVTIPVPVSYLVSGSSWHYLDDGSNQGTAWQTNGFDDSSWSMGTAQLGYGDSDEATVVNFGSDSGNKFITTYFRQSFTVTNASRVQDLTIELLRDDGAVVYLNGSEVVRSNMPTGTITSATVASSAIGGSKEDRFYTYSISPALLRSGTNVIAVEVHQRGGSSSDVSFDLYVTGSETPAPPVNHPPLFTEISNQSVTAGQALSFPVIATDADGPVALVLTSSTLPGNAIFTDNGSGDGQFSWTPSEADVAGSPYSITFTATENNGTGQNGFETVEITVTTSSDLTAFLVKDIYEVRTTLGSHTSLYLDHDDEYGNSVSVGDSVAIGEVLYFGAFTGTLLGSPMELWRSDGTTAGTIRLKSGGEQQLHLAAIGPTLFFGFGGALWRSDGTVAGTVQINSTPSNPVELTVIGSTLYFRARDGVNGTELWKSDGTAAGTVMVKDINTVPNHSSVPRNLVANGSTLYFTANDGINGEKLWKSDGTETGTVPVTTVPSDFSELTPTGSILYFAADDGVNGKELWKSDGTAAGTVMVKDINVGSGHSYPIELTAVGSTLYFRAINGVNGYELWKSDGTAAGTVLVKDINSRALNARALTAVGSTLYFSVFDGELWKSDGTAAGTVMVKDINTGLDSSEFKSISKTSAAVGSTLYFSAGDGVNELELWKSDGTEAGTIVVKNIAAGSLGSFLRGEKTTHLTAVGSRLFFRANDGIHGNELWKSDGTDVGTMMVRDINLEAAGTGGSPSSLRNVGNTLYFVAVDGINGRELWKSDGTAVGTRLVKDIIAGEVGTFQSSFGLYTVGSTLYFAVDDGINGHELWKSDGTDAGTQLLKDINVGVGSSTPLSITAIDSTFYFQADDGINGRELWKSNGTAAGTLLVKDINQGEDDSRLSDFKVVGSTLYFSVDGGIHGYELWKSDGTEAGTQLVKNIDPDTNSRSPYPLIIVGSTLYFRADDGMNGNELWKSDGTAAGTVLVKDINVGSGHSHPTQLTAVGSTLYFSANDGMNGYELWKSDGTAAGTVLVKDIDPRALIAASETFGSGLPRDLTAVGSTLYFTAFFDNQLWKSDGTTAGTLQVNDDINSSAANNLSDLTAVGSVLYFTANDGVHGNELWKSDGTAAGTVLVDDIHTGSRGSHPAYLTVSNGTLYFSATDETYNRELWALLPGSIALDGFSDNQALLLRTDPEINRDGVPNIYTVGINYDPLNPDTDSDRFADGAEIQVGTDPLNAVNTTASTSAVAAPLLSIPATLVILFGYLLLALRKLQSIRRVRNLSG